MEWYWLGEYAPKLLAGTWLTIQLLALAVFFGMFLAIPIGLVQVTGPRILSLPARAFCTTFRGTPLLIQLWLLYYGLGSIFPYIDGIRTSFLWPYLRDAFPYAVVAFTLKATPLAATITVYEIFGVGTIIRQETYRIYEPLLLIAGVYICLTGIIVVLFNWLEGRVPKASG